MHKINKFFNCTIRTILICLVVFALLLAPIEKALASDPICCGCPTCWGCTVFQDLAGWIQDYISLNVWMYTSLYIHRISFWDIEFWTLYMTPAMTAMAEHVSDVALQQMHIIGSFLDAEEQMSAQQDLQILMARAHKDYHPSIGMCEFGSRIKSLAMSERQGEISALAMSQRSQDRMFGNKSSVAPYGRLDDIKNRLNNFRDEYCDRADNNGGLSAICNSPMTTASSTQIDKYNKDIDFARTFSKPLTLDVNFTDSTLTGDEEDVISLSNNLYGFFTFPGVDPVQIKNDPKGNVTPIQQAYLDLRSYVAKQSVAENSFSSLVALKSQGTEGSRSFLEAYLKELGVPASEMVTFLGSNPSYHAQMEILTKLAYQHPSFYTNLYDKPANVERKGVAIQAVGLMQKFDLFKSYLRTEASLSVLLELTVESLQREIEDSIISLDISVGRGL